MLTLGPISSSLFAPALPQVAHDLSTTQARAQLAVSSLLGGLALSQFVCGALSDRYGRKPVLIAFFAVFVGASIWAAASPNIEQLIAARALQGVGAAAGLITSRAIVRDLFPLEQATRIMALMSGVIAVGPALAPFLGALLIVAFGWRATLLALGACAAAVILLTLFGLPSTKLVNVQPLRPLSLLSSLGLLLRTGGFIRPAIGAAIPTGTMYAFAAITPLLLISEIGLTTTEFGLILIAQSGMYVLGASLCRMLLAYWPLRGIIGIGLGIVSLGALGLMLLLTGAPLTVLTVMGPVGLVSFGNGFFFPAFTSQAIYGAPTPPGIASSMLNFLQLSTGFLIATAASALVEPRLAAATVYPVAILAAVACGAFHLSRPEPG
jgi:DHA1 family bicyclomycin/chloramphenicol resistance-like MFS transporter